jgi:hypothetical protein
LEASEGHLAGQTLADAAAAHEFVETGRRIGANLVAAEPVGV